MLESLSESQVLGLLHAELRRSAFNIMAKRRKHYRLRHHGIDIRIKFWHTFIGRLRQFCSELQWHWQWYRWHYWQKLKKDLTQDKRHLFLQCKKIWCPVCSAKNKERRTKFKCRECSLGLRATPCIEVQHNKLHFWSSTDSQMGKQNTQMSVNTTTVITELIILRSVFLLK